MSTPEVTQINTKDKQPLPEKANEVQQFTFKVPHILKSITLDETGFTHREIREGGDRQIDFEMETEYVNEPVKETPFAIKATNQLNFAGSIVNVLNDEVLLPDGFRLVQTSPTASEYLALVGKRTLAFFNCQLDDGLTKRHGSPIYRVHRSFITLP